MNKELKAINQKWGFTTIELLVSITVVFIIMGLTFASYASLNQRQKVVSAGQTMKNTIRDAQSRAFTNEIDCNVCNCDVTTSQSLKGWYVDFARREIYGECASSGAGPIITFSPRPLDVSSEIVITPHVTPVTTPRVMFRSSPPSSDKAATICLSQSNLSNSFYVVRITSAGYISDDGGIVSTCTP